MSLRPKVFSLLGAALLVVTGILTGGPLLWLAVAWSAVVLGLVFAPPLRRKSKDSPRQRVQE